MGQLLVSNSARVYGSYEAYQLGPADVDCYSQRTEGDRKVSRAEEKWICLRSRLDFGGCRLKGNDGLEGR